MLARAAMQQVRRNAVGVQRRNLQLSGVLTNLVTPYTADGAVDFDKLENVVNNQIENGVSGVIPMGTTGECFSVTSRTITALRASLCSPAFPYPIEQLIIVHTLQVSVEEHKDIVTCVVNATAGRVPVVAGTAHCSTAEAKQLTANAKAAGADACLVATPYFNRPGQEGMFLHYEQLAAVGLPITMYNVPGRTNVTMSPATVARCFDNLPEVIAIKEATANMDVATEIKMRCGITVLSGDDSLALPLMAVGGKGVMSVAANLVPKELAQMVQKGLAGDMQGALEIHMRLFPLFQSMVAEVNPVPVKYGTELLGLCPSSLRLPLTPATDATKEQVRKALAGLGANV